MLPTSACFSQPCWNLSVCSCTCLQAYPSLHLPKRGNFLQRPKVHAGFQKCWKRNRFDAAVKARIVEMLKSGELERGKLRFYVTGEATFLPNISESNIAKQKYFFLARLRTNYMKNWNE